MANIDTLQVRLIIQKLINRAANARVIDLDAALPEVNILADASYTTGVQAGPIYVYITPLGLVTVPVAAPVGGTTKLLVAVISDNPVQVGLDAAPSGPSTSLFVTMPNGTLSSIQLQNNSATLTAQVKIFIHGS